MGSHLGVRRRLDEPPELRLDVASVRAMLGLGTGASLIGPQPSRARWGRRRSGRAAGAGLALREAPLWAACPRLGAGPAPPCFDNGNSDARWRVAGCPRMGYPGGMQLPVELTDAQLESLRDRAKSLGISPEQLASAAVADLVERPADDFTRAASKVLSKNAELYRRLAR